MLTSSDVQAGDIAIGATGRFVVLGIEGDRVVLALPGGKARVPVNAIARFERPTEPTPLNCPPGWTGWNIPPDSHIGDDMSTGDAPPPGEGNGVAIVSSHIEFDLLELFFQERLSAEEINAMLAEAYPSPLDKRVIWDWLSPPRRAYLQGDRTADGINAPPPYEGDIATLRGTTRRYRVTQVFDICAGFDNGDPVYETYAKCESLLCGLPATWKHGQLVPE